MCTSPSFVWVKRGAEWIKTPAPCDRCWSCKENYVNDWVGRCLCEAATAEVSVTLSLTYASPLNPLDLSNRVVNPYHFQLFIKRLRKAGHKIRYLVAGEYGDLKGRSHFHAILFFRVLKDQGKPAPKLENRKAFIENPSIAQPLSRQMPQQDMCHIREWPHGHVEADWSCSEKSIRYCCEYLYTDGKRTAWMSQSKKPPLGFYWFAENAVLNQEYGVLPSSFEYMPPGGKPGKKYLMTGATRRDYLNLICKDRAKRANMSKWVRATFDKLERQEFKDTRNAALFDDEAFRERQMPLDKQGSLLVWQEGLETLAAEAHVKALAAQWGFSDVEEFETFVANGGTTNHPEYFRGGPLDLHGGPGHPGTSEPPRPAPRSVKRPATRFDRQGQPQWGEEGRDYLGSAFARPDPGPESGTPDPSSE